MTMTMSMTFVFWIASMCYIRIDCIHKELQNIQLHVNDVDSVSWHRGLSTLVSADTSLSTVEIVKLSMHWKLDVKPHMLVSCTSFAGDCQRGWDVRCSYDITTSRCEKIQQLCITCLACSGRCWLLRGAALGGAWWWMFQISNVSNFECFKFRMYWTVGSVRLAVYKDMARVRLCWRWKVVVWTHTDFTQCRLYIYIFGSVSANISAVLNCKRTPSIHS